MDSETYHRWLDFGYDKNKPAAPNYNW